MATPAKTTAATPHYGQLPLSFEANRGQVDRSIKFLSRGQGYSLLLTDSGALLALVKGGKQDSVRMSLAGASLNNRVAGLDQLPGKVNYFLGNDPTKWQSDLPTYAKVRYSHVYPGIDLVYYGNQRQLEYDFIVAPGANPLKIRLNFTGQKRLQLASNGDLILKSETGSATLHKPVIYQEIEGHHQLIPGSFQLQAHNTITFRIGDYDHTRKLVIDPILVYSTYLGGSGYQDPNTGFSYGDQGNGITVDSTGHAYVVGTTFSADFPTSNPAFQSQELAFPHNYTVFVTKLNAAGDGLLYSTYLGGTAGDFGWGIAIDSTGSAYVTGSTYSTNFPVTCGAFQVENPSKTTGALTGFVSKLDAHGGSLLYSTYLGGSGNLTTPANGDGPQAIAIDAHNNAYVTGYTFSTDFPTTDTAFQTHDAGSATASNAFVAKLNPSGTALSYSTFLGGSGSNGTGDYGNAIALDAAGDAFVTGSTASSNFPVTNGAFQVNGQSNAFVTKLNPMGTDELFSTYLGGTGGDSARGIAVDSNGFVYVAGNTNSSDFPVTPGVLEGTDSGIGAYIGSLGGAFATKLNADGSSLEYSTYLQGQGTLVTGLAVDSSGNAFLTGSAPVTYVSSYGGFQSTADALTPPSSGVVVAFLVKLDPTAATLSYASLLGGDSYYDNARGLALDANDNVYLTGTASSFNFPTTPGTLQTVKHATGEASNAFVSKFALASLANHSTYPTQPVTIATTVNAGGGVGSYCDGFESDNAWDLSVAAILSANSLGPPLTGSIVMVDDEGEYNYGGDPTPVSIAPGTTGFYSFNDGWGYDWPSGPFEVNWQVYYSGDSVYAPSSASGSSYSDGCPSSNSDITSRRKRPARIQIRPQAIQDESLSSQGIAENHTSLHVSGPKFSPPAVVPHTSGLSGSSAAIRQTQDSQACIVPKPVITITVLPAKNVRRYGNANRNFSFTVAGLHSGDTVSEVASTAATPNSPTGTYPVTAIVSGSNLDKYELAIREATITVLPAQLVIAVTGYGSIYGQTPPQPTAYTLRGFVNGDTVGVVSGAPTLLTTVTSTTPAGYYPIQIHVGSLTATNYYIVPFAQAGVVHVTKAPLSLTATSFTIHRGDPLPTFTYTLTGFVNEDTPTSSVTGTAIMRTDARSQTRPGTYPIYIGKGTLAAPNYSFTTVNGTLTILP